MHDYAWKVRGKEIPRVVMPAREERGEETGDTKRKASEERGDGTRKDNICHWDTLRVVFLES